MALILDGLSRVYRNGKGLRDVSTELGIGTHGLLGANGAGKTTLLGLLATAASPTSGSLSYLGRRYQAWDLADLRQQIGYLPQDPVLPGSFPVQSYLRYVCTLRRMGPGRVARVETDRVLEAVGLRERARSRIRTLSGGMRQRVALARALLGSPTLLLLDEPTVGLDLEQRVRLRDMLMELADERVVILSSHQTEDLSAMASSMHVLHAGSLAFSGGTAELVSSAKGSVWLAGADSAAKRPGGRLMPSGAVRHLGRRPDGAVDAEPTLEDAYLLLLKRWPEDNSPMAPVP